jgi:hypothetical protein
MQVNYIYIFFGFIGGYGKQTEKSQDGDVSVEPTDEERTIKHAKEMYINKGGCRVTLYSNKKQNRNVSDSATGQVS